MKFLSRVLHILTGTEDMTHRYVGYDSRVLHIVYTEWLAIAFVLFNSMARALGL